MMLMITMITITMMIITTTSTRKLMNTRHPTRRGLSTTGHDAANEAHANEEAGDIAADDMVEAPAFEAVEAPMIGDDEDGAEMNDDSVETPRVDDEAETMENPLKSTGVGANENPPESPGVGE
jgi:hypothetical protein